MIEPFEGERLPLLHAILEGLAEAGFTIAVFDTAANSASARLVAPAADICLLPTRPTRLDVDVAAATFRAACLAERKAALLLNQCPPTYPSSRTRQAEQALTRFGVLATPTLCARMDFQDAIAIGLGVTEYACEGKAAQEIEALWGWIRAQLESTPSETPINKRQAGQVAALTQDLRPRSDHYFSTDKLTRDYRHAGGAHSRLNGSRFGLVREAANQDWIRSSQKRVQDEHAE